MFKMGLIRLLNTFKLYRRIQRKDFLHFCISQLLTFLVLNQFFLRINKSAKLGKIILVKCARELNALSSNIFPEQISRATAHQIYLKYKRVKILNSILKTLKRQTREWFIFSSRCSHFWTVRAVTPCYH